MQSFSFVRCGRRRVPHECEFVRAMKCSLHPQSTHKRRSAYLATCKCPVRVTVCQTTALVCVVLREQGWCMRKVAWGRRHFAAKSKDRFSCSGTADSRQTVDIESIWKRNRWHQKSICFVRTKFLLAAPKFNRWKHLAADSVWRLEHWDSDLFCRQTQLKVGRRQYLERDCRIESWKIPKPD